MKYLGLAYFTPDKFAAMAPDDLKALVSQCPALDEQMRATGKVLVSASLGDLEHWRTLRPGGGKTRIYRYGMPTIRDVVIVAPDNVDNALSTPFTHWLNPDSSPLASP